jgi:hypothetical protein
MKQLIDGTNAPIPSTIEDPTVLAALQPVLRELVPHDQENERPQA